MGCMRRRASMAGRGSDRGRSLRISSSPRILPTSLLLTGRNGRCPDSLWKTQNTKAVSCMICQDGNTGQGRAKHLRYVGLEAATTKGTGGSCCVTQRSATCISGTTAVYPVSAELRDAYAEKELGRVVTPVQVSLRVSLRFSCILPRQEPLGCLDQARSRPWG